MAKPRKNYIIIFEDDTLKRYSCQSILDIIDHVDNPTEITDIICTGLHYHEDIEYEDLPWHD
jgi:hypothetical protein